MNGPGSGSLVHRTAELLRDGPCHTLTIAEEVLGLKGHPGAASSAVFALLGPDHRFRVDGEGCWSLAPGGVHLGRHLGELSFAVVDVETTGGLASGGHRIIEIAIVEVRGGTIVDDYQSLVNPNRPLPRVVQGLTGIEPRMLTVAPDFGYIAQEVYDRLEGRVFVAHNVGFDWRFVALELSRAGVDVPDLRRLCTVRMARRLVRGLRRRNLDSVTRHFSIPIHERHRAYGDALATARVLIRLLDEAERRGVVDLESLERHLRRRSGRRGSRRQVDLFESAHDESDRDRTPLPHEGNDVP